MTSARLRVAVYTIWWFRRALKLGAEPNERLHSMLMLCRLEARGRVRWQLEACAQFPGRREPWCELAQLQLEMGQPRAARRAAQRALAVTAPAEDYLGNSHAWGPWPDEVAAEASRALGETDWQRHHARRAGDESAWVPAPETPRPPFAVYATAPDEVDELWRRGAKRIAYRREWPIPDDLAAWGTWPESLAAEAWRRLGDREGALFHARRARGAEGRRWFHTAAFGPASIDDRDLAVLAEATAMTPQACLERLSSWSADELAEEWRRADPSTPAEMFDFYAATQGYLWDLFVWHGSAAYDSYRYRLGLLAHEWPPAAHPRAIDYGAGIGTAALDLAALGYQVTIADIPGTTLELAQARFARRTLSIDVMPVGADGPSLTAATWDVAVCFDVLEHVSDPAALARALVAAVRPGGGLAIVTAFDLQGDRYPQHLPDHAAQFGGDRWERFLVGLGVERIGDCIYRRTG